MQKLIPVIYFYLLSAIGMVLIIVGLFNTSHYIVGVTAYDKYPLGYAPESRCEYMPIPVSNGEAKATKGADETKENCLKSVEIERQNKKADDLEKSISFTAIGLLVFGIHFYFARKQKAFEN